MSSGSRRIQRSVRVTVVGVLVALAVCGVALAVATSTGVTAAAIGAAVVAVLAARIMYSEVTQSRRQHGLERSVQAKSFAEALAFNQAEHTAFTTVMTSRLTEKDQTIRELNGTIRLAEARADEAEERVRRESRRANDAQTRLSALLDEVLAAQATGVAPDAVDDLLDLDDLPTIVDLLAWEERMAEITQGPQHLRKEA